MKFVRKNASSDQEIMQLKKQKSLKIYNCCEKDLQHHKVRMQLKIKEIL